MVGEELIFLGFGFGLPSGNLDLSSLSSCNS